MAGQPTQRRKRPHRRTRFVWGGVEGALRDPPPHVDRSGAARCSRRLRRLELPADRQPLGCPPLPGSAHQTV